MMASSIFSKIFMIRSQTLRPNAVVILLNRTISNRPTIAKNKLYSKIMPLGDPNITVAPFLDQWFQEGGNDADFVLRTLIKDLRARKRYAQALQVSEWMRGKRIATFSLADSAVQLDLIGAVRGMESAETYFKNLEDEDKIDKLYGALLNCYVREGHIEKSLSHMRKMKELGFASSPLSYNGIMCLYTRTGQFEKVPGVLSEMKENGVSPDIFSYRICMNSYGARSDLGGVERIIKEIRNEPHISVDWLTYATAASIYTKAGQKEKALTYLIKCESMVNKNALAHNHLISLYANLGKKEPMMRIWDQAKSRCKKLVYRDYITMIGCLVKLGELEESKKVVVEWEGSCRFYDFRVPNVLLIGYCQNGLVEKAEEMLRSIVEKQKTAAPNSWAIIASGYVNKQNLEKAFECMKEALAVQADNKGWRPKPTLISSILSWLGDNRAVEDVEAFVGSLEKKVPKNREMYHALIKTYIRNGKEVDGLLESMKADNIDEDDETKSILNSRLEQSKPGLISLVLGN